jgi:hypothetical protein
VSLTTHLKQLKKRRNAMERKNEKYQHNKQYLDLVLSNNEQYTEIDEMLTRHTILKDMNEDLRAESAAVAAKMEAFQRNLQQLMKQKQNEILVKNSVLARMLKELEDVSNHTSSVENAMKSLELKNKEANRKFGEVHMAIRNIHARAMASYPRKKRQNAPISFAAEMQQQQAQRKDKKKEVGGASALGLL